MYISSEGGLFIIGVYVDDIVLATGNEDRMRHIKRVLGQHFEGKDMGRLHYFLSINVIPDLDTGNIWIGQSTYT